MMSLPHTQVSDNDATSTTTHTLSRTIRLISLQRTFIVESHIKYVIQLDVSDRIKFRLCVTVYKSCADLSAPQAWTTSFCWSRPSRLSSCQTCHLWKAVVCPYAGPSAWNSLPDDLRDTSLSAFQFFFYLN